MLFNVMTLGLSITSFLSSRVLLILTLAKRPDSVDEAARPVRSMRVGQSSIHGALARMTSSGWKVISLRSSPT